MGLALCDQQRHTYREYCTWPEDVRYELIDGQAYAMSPGPSRRHQEIGFEVARQVADALEGTGCRVYVAPFDVRLPRSNEADDDIDTVVQPDLMVVCDRAKLDDRGCRGAPDWVIEVLSPSSAGHDQILKRAVYERHGVKEYWLIHPVDQVVTVYRLVDGAYGKPDIYELKDTLACGILPEVVIDWARVLREE
jgi:Uma2 family endonuclease